MRILWMLYKNDDSQKRKSPFCERCSFWTIDRHIACQSFVWKWSDYTYKMVQCVKYTFNFSECELLELIASTKYSHVLRVVVMSSQYFLYWIQWACQATTRRASVRWSWKWQEKAITGVASFPPLTSWKTLFPSPRPPEWKMFQKLSKQLPRE